MAEQLNLRNELENKREVRLFPSVHLSSDREAELRATASLLAAIRVVSEFGRRIVSLSNGPKGQLACHTEVSAKLEEIRGDAPKKLSLDGVLTVKRGKTYWVAFVEVKVGAAKLGKEQIDKYHQLAKQEKADVLITVSNQPARADGGPPLTLDRQCNIPVVHFSWERLLSQAQVLSEEVSDPDQKWILAEWIRYVDDSNSRIIIPPDLGPHWRAVLEAAGKNALKESNSELHDVALHWVGYLRKAAFRLRAKEKVDVEVYMSRKARENSDLQAQESVNAQEGTLNGTLRIRGTAGNIEIKAILPSRKVQYSLRVAAPTAGQMKTRIGWLSRQLLTKKEDRPSGDLVIVTHWTKGEPTTVPVHAYLEDIARLCAYKDGSRVPQDAKPRSFQIVWTRSFSDRRSRDRPAVHILEGISQDLKEFYCKVVKHIEPFASQGGSGPK